MARRTHLYLIKVFSSALIVAVIGGLMSPASAAGDGIGLAAGTNPFASLHAVEVHADKLPAEFDQRLKYMQPDGTLRVMVALGGRSTEIDSFVAANVTALKWYSATPSFYAAVTPKQLATLLNAGFVNFVEPDYPITYSLATSVPDVQARATSSSGGLWSFDPTTGRVGTLRSEVPGLTADQATGKGVTVATVDSGIDKTHRDFGGWDCTPNEYEPCQSRVLRTVTTEHLVGPGFDFADDLPTTDFASGHGTHVAGIVAGNGYYVRDYAIDDPTLLEPDIYGGDGFPIGVAPQASLLNVKNGDSQWAGLGTAGLDWLAVHAQEYGVRVASNSWGCVGGCAFNGASATNQTFRALYQAGVVVTFAAGNDAGGANGAAFNGNAQSPYVLGVANYNDANHQLSSTSSRGSSAAALPNPASWTPESEPINGLRRPDVAAPGESIWSARSLTGGTSSLVPRQNTEDVTGGYGCCIREYVTMSGTSMATPHVSGAAALLFSACPTATSLDAMRAIMVGANRTRVLKTGSPTAVAEPFEAGYGGLDVKASLTWLLSQPDCVTTPANSAPVANDDSLATNQGVAGTINVLQNDTDADGDTLSVVSASAPAAGQVSIDATGVTYTPNADFHGTDSFEYVVSDGHGGTDTGLVTVDVNGTPVAVDDSAALNQGGSVSISPLGNDSDPEGDAFTITGASAPAHGSVTTKSDSLTYTPDAGFFGTDSFEYQITDAGGASDSALVTVDVNGRPAAADDSAKTKKKDAVRINVIANDSDPEGQALSLSSSTQGAQGSVDCSSTGTCTYVPNGRYKGADSFTYVVCDNRQACSQAVVRVQIS